VRALKRHAKSSGDYSSIFVIIHSSRIYIFYFYNLKNQLEFLKSACGALSNICQSKLNQEGVASLGGLQPIIGSLHIHQNNNKLLPFIFDAIASLIVGNEENSRTVSSIGFIPLAISSVTRHKHSADIVKSGCHALAILTDAKGQASKIAFAGGVTTILPLLDIHPTYSGVCVCVCVCS